jgi:adenine-specific DNA-methyltransferase
MSRHIDKEALVAAIKQSQELSDEQKADILELISTKKKYGLVWEDSNEDAYEELKNKLPILREVENRSILNDTDSEHYPNHILIEGENLQALVALTYTHAGMIDVIYIDPPYNTGNKDFIYNDSFVGEDDEYRHSKWLSFMEKRLRIAKTLLSDKGVIFISIDDNEQANLKLLCDEVFGQRGFVGNIIWQSRTSISNDDYISTNHNHTLIYSRNRDGITFYGEKLSMEGYVNPDNDPRGPWKLVPIDANHPGGDTIYGIVNPKTGIEYYPPTNRIWAYSRVGMQKLMDDGRIKFGINDDSSPKKKLFYNERIEKGDTKTPSSILLDAKTTKDGTNELIDILDEKRFDYPKPSELIKRLLTYSSLYSKNHIVLDFFAGSGTTLHATMQLNAEDGGYRQCILVTNNENGICEKVTYERNKRVIQGYTTPKGEQVAGLTKNNLRYYKLDLIERTNDHQQNRELMRGLKDLLCIKDNIYQEVMQFGSLSLKGKESMIRCFAEGEQQMLMVYDSRVIPYLVKEIMQMPKADTQIKIYLFADGAYPYTEDFATVMDKVQLIPMPYAYLRAINYLLPEANPSWADNADLTEDEQQEMMDEAIEAENNENE